MAKHRAGPRARRRSRRGRRRRRTTTPRTTRRTSARGASRCCPVAVGAPEPARRRGPRHRHRDRRGLPPAHPRHLSRRSPAARRRALTRRVSGSRATRCYTPRRHGQASRDRGIARQGADDRALPRRGLPGPRLVRPRPRPAREPGQGQVRRRRRPRLRARVRDPRGPPQAGLRDREGGQAARTTSGSPPTSTARARRSRGTWPRPPTSPSARRRRVTFTEITEGAIREAFASPREIDQDLVDAQQARRIVDRLVGYTLSPLLSRKVRGGLSAGRVQSVAVRMVVEREREIRAFTAREYWTLEALLATADGRHVHRGPRADRRQDASTSATARPPSGHADGASRRLQPVVESIAHAPVEAQPGPAVHDQHAPAGGEPQARLQPQADDVDRPAAVRGRRHARRPRRPHHLHADRLDRDRRRGDGRGAGGDHARASASAYGTGKGRVYKTKAKGAQEAHESIRPTSFMRDPGLDARAPQGRGAAALPPDLAAGDRLADGAQGARDHDRGARRRATTGCGPRRRGRCSTASPGSTPRARTTPPPRRPSARSRRWPRATSTRVQSTSRRPSTSPSRRRATPRRR